jgi:hypothetical protein
MVHHAAAGQQREWESLKQMLSINVFQWLFTPKQSRRGRIARVSLRLRRLCRTRHHDDDILHVLPSLDLTGERQANLELLRLIAGPRRAGALDEHPEAVHALVI